LTAVFSNATAKGHFCELLVSNIIGYLAFYWIVDLAQIQSFIPLKPIRNFSSQSEIYLIVGEKEDLKGPTAWFHLKRNIKA
jgi:hypothetical protein